MRPDGGQNSGRFLSDLLDLRLADCMTVMSTFPDGYFDLAIVDPPYGINANKFGLGRRKNAKPRNYKMGDWDSFAPGAEYFQELRRVSKNQIVWGANHFIESFPTNSPCWIVWDKNQAHGVSFAAAELAWTSFDRTCKKFVLRPTQADRIHPTQKPVQLYSWILANFAKAGDRIIDTHLGSGSIAIACSNAGCSLVGCEIDEEYFAAACARIEREAAQLKLFFDESNGSGKVVA